MLSPQERRARTLRCLEGLAVGDAFGEQFFDRPYDADVGRHELLPAPWPWTDDTHMALSIVDTLFDRSRIDQMLLVERFVRRYTEDPERGYGTTTARVLKAVSDGATWQDEARTVASGGSFGNGAAMRAAPIGAFFSTHPARAADEARLSAAVTHSHTEGMAGAIAVAVMAALLGEAQHATGAPLLKALLRYVPRGQVRTGIEQAITIAPHEHPTARSMLGVGNDRTAFDTVPFCLWTVAHHGESFEDALWLTAAAGGDVDTTCAIVGALLGASGKTAPAEWRRCCEPLPPALQLEPEDT